MPYLVPDSMGQRILDRDRDCGRRGVLRTVGDRLHPFALHGHAIPAGRSLVLGGVIVLAVVFYIGEPRACRHYLGMGRVATVQPLLLRRRSKLGIIRASNAPGARLGQVAMEFQDRGRNVGGARRQESLRGGTGAGRDRPHRAPRRQDQRGLRARFRTRSRGRARRRRGRARGETRRCSAFHDGEGILQRRGPADDLGQSGAEGFHGRRKTRCRLPGSRRPAA